MKVHSAAAVHKFFELSDSLDYLVLRPLSHIACDWELIWDRETGRFEPEEGSFAEDLNFVLDEIQKTARPARYHDHEDVLAENTLQRLKWPIQKKGKLWIGADYQSILEQGAFSDWQQQRLIAAATGRVHAALDFGQNNFDEMEHGHRNMLAALLAITVYHRYCDGSSSFKDN